jgi:Spy/CpxP family protein refolding chaperone
MAGIQKIFFQAIQTDTMNKINFLLGCVIALLLLNAGTVYFLYRGHPSSPAHARPGEGPAQYIISQLKFDDGQQKEFADLRASHQQQSHQIHDEEKRLHDEYFNLLKTDQPDMDKVDSVATLIAQQQKMLETAAFAHFRSLRALCRPDQKILFDHTIDNIARMVGQQGPPAGGPPPTGM